MKTVYGEIAPITADEREKAVESVRQYLTWRNPPSWMRPILAYEAALRELEHRFNTEAFNHEACEHESEYQRQRAELAEQKIAEAESK